MAIPVAYNLRNLAVRKTTTVLTTLGLALTIAVLMATLALVHGMQMALRNSGDPLHVLVMQKGSSSELYSSISRQVFQDLKFKPGIERGRAGEPLASLEIVTVLNLQRADAVNGMNVMLRGVQPTGLEMRRELKLVAGRWFEAGKREVLTGEPIAGRFPQARLGSRLRFGRGQWTVVGIVSAGNTAANSEIFADLEQVSSDYQRADALSSVLVRAADGAAAKALVDEINRDTRLNVDATLEKEYYGAQVDAAVPIRYLGIFVAIVMAAGSSFAAMNTMYAAVARRTGEIAVLRVLGFSRRDVLWSFLVESILYAILGAALACVLLLPFTGKTTVIGNFNTASELDFDFHMTSRIALYGLGFGVGLGAIGGVLPARQAARKEILTALREL